MRVIRILALLMIYLIISLTFITAFAFATIYKAEILGQDNVPGSIRSNDNVRIRTESTMPCSVIGQSFNLTEYTAMTCTGGAPVVCTYTKSLKDQFDSVNAIVRESGSGMTQQAYAYPDLLAPAFISLSMMSLGNSVRASYSLRDFGNEFHQEKCSGIKKVELLINNQLANSTEYPFGMCDVTGTITASKANFVGNVNTSMKIYDYMGYTANRTGGEVFIDTVPPVIQTAVKAYRPGTDEQITSAVTNATITRTIEVRITVDDNAIPPNGGATADFSMFDRTGNVDQSNVEAVCNRDGWENSYICSFPGVRLNPAKLSLQFPVNVTDTLGNTAGKVLSITFTAHAGASIASTGKAFVSGSTENEIKKISTNSTRARAVDALVSITGSAPLITVTGNFQELSQTAGTSQRSVPGECFLVEPEEGSSTTTSTYSCWFHSITLNPSKTSPKAAITATDELGKEVTKNVSFSFTNVPSAGTVTRLGPDTKHCQGNTCYLKAGSNTVYAQLSTQSTFFDSQVRINGVRAECRQGNTWNCTADVTVGVADTTLTFEGTDDFGNVISYQSSMVVDGAAPVMRGEINITPSCPTSEESLKIIMNVTEDKGPVLKISSVTNEISTDNVSQAACTRVGQTTQWKCLLTVNNILEQEIESATLNVVVEDLAGNSFTEEVPVSVCINVDEVPDLIEQVKVIGRLPRVDRKTAKAITLKLPIGLEIVPSGDIEIISRSNVKCPETPCISGTPYMVNDAGLKPTLILPIRWTESCQDTLDEMDSPDTIPVTCSQEYKIRSGNRIYKYMEQENFTFELDMYNQIGLNSTYNAKISEIKKEIQRLDKQIEKREKVNKVLGGICTLAENLGKVNALLQSIHAAVWAVAVVLPFVSEAIWQPVTKAINPYTSFVNTKIWPQGWIPIPPSPAGPGNTIGLMVKYTCAVYTCKFYDFNTFADIVISIAAHYATKDDNTVIEKSCDGAGNCVTKYEQGDIVQTNADGSKYVYDPRTYTMTGYDKDGNLIGTMTQAEALQIFGPLIGVNINLGTTNSQSGRIPEGQVVALTDGSGGYIDNEGNIYRPNSDGSYTVTNEQGIITSNIATLPEVYAPIPEGTVEVTVSYGNDIVETAERSSPNTVEEVKEWQSANGLDPDGIIGPLTQAAMAEAGVTPPYLGSNTQAPPPTPVITSERISNLFANTQNYPLSITITTNPIYLYPLQPNLVTWDFRNINMKTVDFDILGSRVIASDQLTGYSILSTGKNLAFGKNFMAKYGAGPGASFDMNVRIGNALDAFMGDSGSWIYNPYKSKHYDGMCYPATLFNDKKEQQILCKRLGCLEAMAKSGGPIGACEFEYNLDMCMYVESARYKLEGSATFGRIIGNFFKVAFNNIVGLGTTITYLFIFPGCVHYQTGIGWLQDSGPAQSPGSLRSVLCGTIGSLMSIRELLAFMNNPFNPLGKDKGPPALPADSYDYCSKVDYK